MTKLTIEQIEHIARLSRLQLSQEEKETYPDQLSSILNYVEQLSEVETSKIQPLPNVTGLKNISRPDEIKPSGISEENIAKNAPIFRDGNFIVPGVFE